MAGLTDKYIYEGILALCCLIAILKTTAAQQIIGIDLKTRKFIFCIIAFLFGLIHISTFSPLYPNLFWAYPVFVLPQIIMGFGFGYVRIKYGFLYGFILHFMVNFMFLILSFVK
ncbi:CPBP family glutamic-type intramembrane protease [Arachidicoccus terrestris]|uniref:CPBP family glutamic-type intramembrane protease n=1 Tax=Arachidicoccus terrestris TaxID=2875539 RepID=UPI0037448F07|nr:CPBP family intramembrane metalloprotease [Arachidicoccus terrestris]